MTFPSTDGAELERAKRALANMIAVPADQHLAVAHPEPTPVPAPEPAAKSKSKAKPKAAVVFAEEGAAAIEQIVDSGVVNIDAMLAEARSRLALAPAANTDSDQREASNPEVVNALLAKAAELKRTEDSAKKERAKITDLLAEIAGPVTGTRTVELIVNDAPVFTVSVIESRGLNVDYIKSAHPDIPGNDAYWKTTKSTRRNYK
jgi:hypothetical protein